MSINFNFYTDKDIDELAENWFVECEHNDEQYRNYHKIMLEMYDTADGEFIWIFINRALVIAQNDGDLEQLAAGPVENFLPKYGEKWISKIESVAKHHYRFARLLSGTWQTTTPDYIWRRIEAIKETIGDPLPW